MISINMIKLILFNFVHYKRIKIILIWSYAHERLYPQSDLR